MSSLTNLQLFNNSLHGRVPGLTAASLFNAFQCLSTVVLSCAASRYSARSPGNTLSLDDNAVLGTKRADRWATH